MSDRIDHGNSYKACVQESKRASPNNHLPWCRHGYETSFEEVTRSVPRLLKSLQESQSNQTRYDFNRNNDNESHGIKFEKEVISSESTATISSEENPTKAEDKYTEKDINEKDVIVNTTRHFSSLISMNTKSNLDKKQEINNEINYEADNTLTDIKRVDRGNDKVPFKSESKIEVSSQSNLYNITQVNESDLYPRIAHENISSESTATISSEETPTKAEDKYTEKNINEKDVIVNTTRHFSSLISMNTKSNLDKKQEINIEINNEVDNTPTDRKRVDRGNDKVPVKSESKIEVSSQSNFYNINQVNESDLHSRITDIIYEDVLNYTVQVSSLDTFSNDSKSPSSSILDGTVNINSSTNILSPVDEF